MLPISKIMLKYVHGGADEKEKPSNPPPKPQVEVHGGGNAHHAGGMVIITIPVSKNTDVNFYVNGDTANGVNGGGMGWKYKF